MKRALLIGALFLNDCGFPYPDTLCLDPKFTSSEVELVQVAVDRWHDASSGRINLRLLCSPGQNVNLHRIDSSYPEIPELDEHFHGQVEGVTSQGQISIVVDRTGDSFRQVVQHELGHYIGMRWPECSSPRDCVHSPPENGQAIMTAAISGAREFTPADYAFCAAAGLCPYPPPHGD